MPPRRDLDGITEQVIGAAIEVHRALGPGLLESAYEACLAFELTARGLAIEQQRALPLTYRDVKLECAYRLDLVVEGSIIVEVKAIDHVLPVHHAQVISYLKLSGCTVGLLINFHSAVLSRGIRRFVNGYLDASSSASSASSASASSASSAPLR